MYALQIQRKLRLFRCRASVLWKVAARNPDEEKSAKISQERHAGGLTVVFLHSCAEMVER